MSWKCTTTPGARTGRMSSTRKFTSPPARRVGPASTKRIPLSPSVRKMSASTSSPRSRSTRPTSPSRSSAAPGNGSTTVYSARSPESFSFIRSAAAITRDEHPEPTSMTRRGWDRAASGPRRRSRDPARPEGRAAAPRACRRPPSGFADPRRDGHGDPRYRAPASSSARASAGSPARGTHRCRCRFRPSGEPRAPGDPDLPRGSRRGMIADGSGGAGRAGELSRYPLSSRLQQVTRVDSRGLVSPVRQASPVESEAEEEPAMLLFEIGADDRVEALGQNDELVNRDRVPEVPAGKTRLGGHVRDLRGRPRLADRTILGIGTPSERFLDCLLPPVRLRKAKYVRGVEVKPDGLVVVHHDPCLAIGPQHTSELLQHTHRIGDVMEYPRSVHVVDRCVRQWQPRRALADPHRLWLGSVERETLFGLAQRPVRHVHPDQPRRLGILDEAHQVVPGPAAVVEDDLAVLPLHGHMLQVVEVLLGAPPEVPQRLVAVPEATVLRHVIGRPELLRRLGPPPRSRGEPCGPPRESHPPPGP